MQWHPFSEDNIKMVPTRQAWLTHPGSFIERLKAYGVKNPVVKVLREAWEWPTQGECDLLQITEKAFIREVLILTEETIWMYARSVFPAATLTGDEEILAALGNRSLGSVLFNHPHWKRGAFEMQSICQGMPLYEKVIQETASFATSFWARRSLFFLKHKSLLLTEVFMPTVWELNDV